VTEWLAQLSAAHEPPAGEPAEARQPPPGAVTDTLFGWLYNELRRAAASQLRREDAGHTLSATALAHEAWFRLSGQHRTRWENRSHFLAVASVMMRRILVNHAAARHADKRDVQHVSLTLTEAQQVGGGVSADVLAVHEALLAFEAVDPRAAQVVELRFFGGLENEEIAQALGLSLATVKRDWVLARAWLHRALSAG
jgi:RNA polymerase sigma factor (TIGR02999 family)